MNDEELIDCVCQYPVLFDLSDPKYMDLSFKKKIWDSIGKQMKTNGATCKSRWNNIRDTYRKSLKKAITRSGQRAKTIKQYKYAERLGFLKKYFNERETSNIDDQEDQRQGEAVHEYEDSIQFVGAELGSEEDSLSRQSSPSPVERKEKAAFQTVAKHVTPKEFAKKSVPAPSASSNLTDYHHVYKNQNEASTSAQHPVDSFLAAMAPTLKTLSPYEWHLAKSEIFATVQKYELKTIMGQHSDNALDNITPSSNFSTTE